MARRRPSREEGEQAGSGSDAAVAPGPALSRRVVFVWVLIANAAIVAVLVTPVVHVWRLLHQSGLTAHQSFALTFRQGAYVLFLIAMLVWGAVLEWMRSLFAPLLNVGIMFVLLVAALIRWFYARGSIPLEAGGLFRMVVFLLGLLTAFTAGLYYYVLRGSNELP